ncbi:MAG TPA: sialidase family protein [Candidatus Hydrogenedentes bacterium]|nr:sialidase family protein [Candidatus Hydrogenedentota bacterium]
MTALIIALFAFLPAQTAPLFEDIHVVPLPQHEYGYRGMPGSMVQLQDGRLLLTYSGMTVEGQDTGAIAARYSSDLGKTWTEESTLIATPQPAGQGRYCHPSLLRLSNGQLLLSYIYVSGSNPLFGHNYYRRSADDGKTWGDQLIVTPKPGYHIMHNDKLVQLSSGRIIAPVEFSFATTTNDHAGYVSYTWYSDDNGYSWHESDNMVKMLPVETQEPHVVELKDGRLLMLMRTYSGYVAKSYSADQGKTWSEGEAVKELSLPPNSSALNIKRIPATNDLLLLRSSQGPKEGPYRRTPFVSVISKDDGNTWENERIIQGDPEDDYGYPSLLFVENLALISYHQRDGLHVARIGTDWFGSK